MSTFERYPDVPPTADMTPTGPALAGWWRRVGASIIDGLIIGLPSYGIAQAGVNVRILVVVIGLLYTVTLLGYRGRTVGNIALGTTTVAANPDSATGPGIGYPRALLRWFVQEALSITVIGGILDLLWPLWDDNNQTIHDKAASTLVIRS